MHHTESSGPLDLASRSMAASRSEVDLTRAVRHLPMARAAHAPLQAVPWGRSPTQSHDFELRAAQSGGWGAQGRMAGVGDEGTLRGGVGADGLPALARRPGIGIESVYRSSSDMANRASFDAPGVGVGALGSHQHQRSPFSATSEGLQGCLHSYIRTSVLLLTCLHVYMLTCSHVYTCSHAYIDSHVLTNTTPSSTPPLPSPPLQPARPSIPAPLPRPFPHPPPPLRALACPLPSSQPQSKRCDRMSSLRPMWERGRGRG